MVSLYACYNIAVAIVPLLSRLLPNDVCRIYKSGSCIRYTLIPIPIPSFPYQYPHFHSNTLIPIPRLDSTLGDFTEMQWTRGDISFIYNGDDTPLNQTLSVVALDNNKKCFQTLSLASGVSYNNQLQ